MVSQTRQDSLTWVKKHGVLKNSSGHDVRYDCAYVRFLVVEHRRHSPAIGRGWTSKHLFVIVIMRATGCSFFDQLIRNEHITQGAMLNPRCLNPRRNNAHRDSQGPSRRGRKQRSSFLRLL